MTEQQSLQWDADRVMEQLIMQESRHMQMGALVSFQLHYPDMTIRDFFAMASEELEILLSTGDHYDRATITRVGC